MASQSLQHSSATAGPRGLHLRGAATRSARPDSVRRDLTDREREVLGLAGQGLSIKGIAQALGISSGTVTWHLKNCYQKYGVGSREQALRQARLQEQVGPVRIAVCECGRVHKLWDTVAVEAAWKEGKQG